MKTITQHNSKRNIFRFLFAMAFVGMSFSSFAATVYLKNAHDGAWETVANWVTTSGGSTAYGSIPQAGDYVIIPNTVTKMSLSINSAVTIEKLWVKTLTLTINSGASLNVTQTTLSSPTVSIATGTIINNGTFGVTSGAYTGDHYLIQLDDDGSTVTSSAFTNNGTLNVNNTALVGTINTTKNATIINLNQITAGTTPNISLSASGTINLSLKPYTAPSGSVAGFQPRLFAVTSGANAIIDGNFTFGSAVSPLVRTRIFENGNASSVLTIPSGANFTFYCESSGSQISTYPGKLTNNGTLTFNAPSSTGQYQGLFGLGALENTGIINFTGKWTNRAITFGNINGQIYTLNNTGTINVNSTGACTPLIAYLGTNSGTYAAPGTANSIFQLTNSGTLNLYATGNPLSINIGNNNASSWFKNTSTGIINVNAPIASGNALSVTSGGLYKESPASTSMKFYNAGIVSFDLSTNLSNATKFLKNSDGGSTNTAGNYALVNFINALDGVGGTVKGRGKFLEGSFDNSTGTLSPGYGTTTFNYGGSTATSTQVGTANIGQFDIQGVSVALTGKVSLDINGTDAATTGYDQIINSTVSGVLNVAGVSLTATAGYTPAANTTFEVFKATDAAGTRTGTLVAATLPSNQWSVSYATANAVVIFDTATGIESVLDNSKISVQNNNLMIKDATGKTANVYAVTGKLMKSINCTDAITTISLSKGLYLVSVNGQKAKVLIQ
jgi:hypothetical protein